MGRNSERGQMIIEMLVMIFMFTGLFLLAIAVSDTGDRAQSKYRFPGPTHFHKRGHD